MKLKSTTKTTEAKPSGKAAGAQSHSRISPSTLSALKACPGYESDHKASAASERGDKMHAIQETQRMDETLELRDQKTADLVLLATRQFDARSEYEPLKELELDFNSLKLKDFEQGTLDRAIVLEDSPDGEPVKMAVIDYKFGRWEVDEVRDNIQFRAYTLGLWLMFPTVDEVEYTLIQPEHDLHETYVFSRKRDFEMIKTQIGAIVKRRHKYLETKDGSMLRSHPDYCAFCMRQAACPVWQSYMVKLANESNCLAAPVVPIEKLESVDTADEDELVRVMQWIKPMEEYLKKLKKFALAVYDAGRLSTDRIVLTEKAGDPTIIDSIRVGEVLHEEYGISEGEYRAACSISVTKIKELVSATAATGEKGKAADAAVELLVYEGLIERGNPIRYVSLKRQSKRKI